MENQEELKIFICLPNGQKQLERDYKSWIEKESKNQSFRIIQRLMTTTAVSLDSYMVDFTTISIFYTK